ncbi:MAG: putative glycolipid-binding domain-containing protein [Nitriliruptoraceae bacterium]
MVARTSLDGTHLRAMRDEDTDGLIALVGAAYAEYDGCVLDLPGVDADLTAPATTAAARGGRWWALEREGTIVGSVGAGPVDEHGVLELKRWYLAAELRGRGLGARLVTRVETHAAGLGATTVELWSDSRFELAHARYARLGYHDTGQRRDLHDPSETTEFHFRKALVPDETVPPVHLDGPFGEEEVIARGLPDGNVLRGRVAGCRYVLEVDHAWRPRRVLVVTDSDTTTLTSDGAGRWWQRGEPVEELAGCTDIGLGLSPAAVQFPIRRLGLQTGAGADVRLALLPHPLGPGPAAVAEPTRSRFDRTGVRSYRQHLDDADIDIEVDQHGLPLRVGTQWRRREMAETA